MSLVRIGLSPRANGLSRRAAQEHWAGAHARLFAQVPHVKSYVQNHALLTSSGEPLLGDPQFDIFSEVEVECEADMAAAMASAWYCDQVIPDEHKLLDPTRRCFLVTRRFGPRSTPAGARCKLVEFIAGKPGQAATSSPHAWLEDDRLAELVADAAAKTAVYLVDAAGGAMVRPVQVVVARWCETAAQACEIHQRLCESLHGVRGLSVHTAVVVRECQVLPRVAERQAQT